MVLAYVEERKGATGLVAIILSLWIVSFGPIVVLFAAQGFRLTWAQYATDFLWPPAQLADFMIGAAAAAIALRHAEQDHVARGSCASALMAEEAGSSSSSAFSGTSTDSDASSGGLVCWASWAHCTALQRACRHSCSRALLADASFAIMAAAVLLSPPPATHAECQTDWNALFSHEWALAIAAFLYGSAPAGRGGLFAQLLSHKALVALGAYSFEVYLFQWVLVAIFHCIFDEWPLSSEVFMAFLLTLWLVSGLYVEWVAAPMTRVVRGVLKG
mmetsp:Transcript_67438/g.135383  ORF Transcript_67438/g.135383 Transcript_67438/m.135383 type:complete len:273 (+) Transcript_67438:313-1131(+)